MAGDAPQTEIDALLAAAMRGEAGDWSARLDPALGIQRILYHGIAGLIVEQACAAANWPAALIEPVRAQAIAQAMWEIQHKARLAELLVAFAEAGMTALLLKGSALAYDLYAAPAARARGDSDVLVAAIDLAEARRILDRLGFARDSGLSVADDLALQEVWSARDDATWHHIDLHWQLLNAPALAGVLPFDRCADGAITLPRLGPGAMAMRHVATLLHTCIHRAMHITAPYFVDGRTYYGGDRLIWANDIHLLASSLSEAEWDAFAAAAVEQSVAEVALDGLDVARTALGTRVPAHVRSQLGEARGEAASAYLLSAGQARRSWSDLRAIPGLRRKLAYAAARLVPSASFMRSKYPALGDRPLVALYARRMIDLVRRRPAES